VISGIIIIQKNSDRFAICNQDGCFCRTHLALPESLTSQLSIPKLIDAWDSLRPDPITFGDGFGGISDITMGPDGYLYVVSINTGTIYRIIPTNYVTSETTISNTSQLK